MYTNNHVFQTSSIVDTELSFFVELINVCVEYTNAKLRHTFLSFTMNKMRRNLIKLRSGAYNSWFNRSDRFSSNFKVDKCLGFRLVD